MKTYIKIIFSNFNLFNHTFYNINFERNLILEFQTFIALIGMMHLILEKETLKIDNTH